MTPTHITIDSSHSYPSNFDQRFSENFAHADWGSASVSQYKEGSGTPAQFGLLFGE